MISVKELNQWMKEGSVLSSREVVLTIYPYHKGTAFKLSGTNEELFISETKNTLYYHSAHSRLMKGHPFIGKCYFISQSLAKPISIGIKV